MQPTNAAAAITHRFFPNVICAIPVDSKDSDYQTLPVLAFPVTIRKQFACGTVNGMLRCCAASTIIETN
jgi:hypothetical protein